MQACQPDGFWDSIIGSSNSPKREWAKGGSEVSAPIHSGTTDCMSEILDSAASLSPTSSRFSKEAGSKAAPPATAADFLDSILGMTQQPPATEPDILAGTEASFSAETYLTPGVATGSSPPNPQPSAQGVLEAVVGEAITPIEPSEPVVRKLPPSQPASAQTAAAGTGGSSSGEKGAVEPDFFELLALSLESGAPQEEKQPEISEMGIWMVMPEERMANYTDWATEWGEYESKNSAAWVPGSAASLYPLACMASSFPRLRCPVISAELYGAAAETC